MPLINGRFYMNPAAGTALERARIAEGQGSGEENSGQVADGPRDAQGRFAAAGPVHHVEIEAGDGGFVARVHRSPVEPANGSPSHGGVPPQPATHVFADHNDLVEFLRNELGSQ
jgi:hypothetical protein